MIVKLLIDFLTALCSFVVGLFPTAGPPSWWSDASGYIAQVWAYGNQLGSWIPWQVAAVCIPAVFVAIGIGVAIRTFRIILSLFTGGGGSAA